MTEPDYLRLRLNIEPAGDGDADEAEQLARRLRAELSGLNLDLLTTLSASELSPAPQQGTSSTIPFVDYIVQLPTGMLSPVFTLIRWWLGRGKANRRIQVTIGSDSIELTGVTEAEQQQLIDEFLRRHSAG
ncbi:effector-associated constant component EACC1 [Lentzea sp. NPDC004789]|jgi:hypothetical protein